MTVRDPELEAIRSSLIAHRNAALAVGDRRGAAALDDTIDTLNRHPVLSAQRRAALDEIARLALGNDDLVHFAKRIQP